MSLWNRWTGDPFAPLTELAYLIMKWKSPNEVILAQIALVHGDSNRRDGTTRTPDKPEGLLAALREIERAINKGELEYALNEQGHRMTCSGSHCIDKRQFVGWVRSNEYLLAKSILDDCPITSTATPETAPSDKLISRPELVRMWAEKFENSSDDSKEGLRKLNSAARKKVSRAIEKGRLDIVEQGGDKFINEGDALVWLKDQNEYNPREDDGESEADEGFDSFKVDPIKR